MPRWVPALFQLLVVVGNIGFAVVDQRAVKTNDKSRPFPPSLPGTRGEGNARQLSVMLNLILQGGQLLNDRLSFFALLIIGDITNGAMKIINGTSLLFTNNPRSAQTQRLLKDTTYHNDRPTVVGRNRGEARLVGGEILR